jgi:hypothetical protein
MRPPMRVTRKAPSIIPAMTQKVNCGTLNYHLTNKYRLMDEHRAESPKYKKTSILKYKTSDF